MDLLVVIIGEAIFITLFAVGIQFGKRSAFQSKSARVEPTVRIRRERLFLYILVWIGFFIGLHQMMSPTNDLQTTIAHSEGIYFRNISEMLFGWLKGFFEFASLISCCIVLLTPKNEKKYSKVIRIVAIVTLALIVIMGLVAGIRGRVVWVVSLLVIVGFVNKRKEPFLIGFFLIAINIPLFVFLGGPYRSIYYSAAKYGTDKLELLSIIAQEAGPIIAGTSTYSSNSSHDNFIRKIADRAQAPRNSVVLFNLYRNGASAGFRPLMASFTTVVPRIFWPEKRPAGSIDSSTYGSAIYLVRRLGHGSPFYNMGPYLASAHAYWEGGWIWLFFIGLGTGLIWNLLLRWYEKSGRVIALVVVLVFTGGVGADGLLNPLQPLFEFIRLFWVTIFPIYMLNKTIDTISNRNRKFFNRNGLLQKLNKKSYFYRPLERQ